jgi:MFS family permease
VLALGYLLLQVSDDVGTGPYSALIPDLVPEDRRGRASGTMGLMTLAGQVVIGIYGFLLGSVQAIYIGLAVINVLAALWTMACLKGEVANKPEAGHEPFLKSFIKGWIEPWKNKDFFWIWFTRFLNSLGFYLIQPYLRFYLEDVVKDFSFFGLVKFADAGQATIVIALVISLFGAFGSIWATKVTDKLGRKRVIYIAGTLMSLVLIPFVIYPVFSAILLLACAFGVGYGMYLSADWALAADVLQDSESTGKDMGVWQMSQSSVQIFSGVAGRAVDVLNKANFGVGYRAIFGIGAVAFFISTILIKKVRGSS